MKKETKAETQLRRIEHVANSKVFYRKGKLSLIASMAREGLKPSK